MSTSAKTLTDDACIGTTNRSSAPIRLLMMAHHFPPLRDSGCFRPLGFAKYLPQFGIQPIVVTRTIPAENDLDDSPLRELPEDVQLERVSPGQPECWNDYMREQLGWMKPISRGLRRPEHFLADAISWRLPNWLPDIREKAFWMRPLIDATMKIVARYQPDAIWATGPRYDTLKAAAIVSKKCRLPLITDLRDPWTWGLLWNPSSRIKAASERRWERFTVQQSSAFVLTSPLTCELIQRQYPQLRDRFHTITNGFDTNSSTQLANRTERSQRMLIRYVGALPKHRHPQTVLDALQLISRERPEVIEQLEMQFIGPVSYSNSSDMTLEQEIQNRNLRNTVKILPPVSQHESRQLMSSADVLLLLQQIEGDGNDVISGKIFEYLAAGVPILGVVGKGGGDEYMLRETGGTAACFRDVRAISNSILKVWEEWTVGRQNLTVDRQTFQQFHRRNLTQQLADLVKTVVSNSKSSL